MPWAGGGAGWAWGECAPLVHLWGLLGPRVGQGAPHKSCPHGKDEKTQRGQVLIHRLWSEWVALLGAGSMP